MHGSTRCWLIALALALVPLRASRTAGWAEAASLAADVAAAVAETPWLLVRFGTPAAEPFPEQGVDVPARRRDETWADARRRVEIPLRFADVRPRVAVLDLAAFPPGWQAIRRSSVSTAAVRAPSRCGPSGGECASSSRPISPEARRGPAGAPVRVRFRAASSGRPSLRGAPVRARRRGAAPARGRRTP